MIVVLAVQCINASILYAINIITTRRMAMPSVMAARWVGQFRPLAANSIDSLMPVLWAIAVGWVRTPGLFLAVCESKYTELSLPVRECP